MRLTESRLLEIALGALEEVVAECHHAEVPRSKALALVLAYLASRSRGERWPYDRLWTCIEDPKPKERWSGATAALNAIYLAGGWTRDIAVVSRYEKAARARRLKAETP
jgi:hypothetical protein